MSTHGLNLFGPSTERNDDVIKTWTPHITYDMLWGKGPFSPPQPKRQQLQEGVQTPQSLVP